jgi:murein DD-endopeptidase MepM/ murein hydrolase activator NlpD
MWPFKRKKKALPAAPAENLVLAKSDGVVEQIMYDYIVVGGTRYDTKKPLVQIGKQVKKGQPVGK